MAAGVGVGQREGRMGIERGDIQMCDWNWCTFDRLHPSISIQQSIHLDCKLGCQRTVEPASFKAAADVAFHQHGQL